MKNRETEDIPTIIYVLEGHSESELRSFCRRKIQPLLEHDARYGSDYAETLRTYLLCSCNLILSSRELFIHRNTMVQRMRKIEGLLGVSFHQASVINDFYNAYLILDKIGETEDEPEQSI